MGFPWSGRAGIESPRFPISQGQAGSAGRSPWAASDRNGRLIGHGARSPQHLHTVEGQRSCLLIPASPTSPAGRRPESLVTHWLSHHYLTPIATFRAESTTHTKPNWPARTVARMVELLGQLPKENPTEADRQKFVRASP